MTAATTDNESNPLAGTEVVISGYNEADIIKQTNEWVNQHPGYDLRFQAKECVSASSYHSVIRFKIIVK